MFSRKAPKHRANDAYLSNLNTNAPPPLNNENLFSHLPPLPTPVRPPPKIMNYTEIKKIQEEEKKNQELLAAVKKDTTEDTERLLQQGANPNVTLLEHMFGKHYMRKPLIFWATLPNLRVLLAHGADPNLRSSNGRTLLNYHCYNHVRDPLHPENDKIDEIRLLLNNNADPNIPADDRDAPLHSVCRTSIDNIVIRLLLEHGAEPNLLNRDGRSPLHCIAENHKVGNVRYDIPFTQSIKMLIDAGADPTIRNEKDHTPSQHAADLEIPTSIVVALQHAEQGLPLPPHPPRLNFPPPPPPPVPAPYHFVYEDAQDPHNNEAQHNNNPQGGRRRRRRLTRKGIAHKRRVRTRHRRRH